MDQRRRLRKDGENHQYDVQLRSGKLKSLSPSLVVKDIELRVRKLLLVVKDILSFAAKKFSVCVLLIIALMILVVMAPFLLMMAPILVVVVPPVLLCYWCCRRRQQNPTNGTPPSGPPSARDALNNFLDTKENRSKYLLTVEINCLGSRLHKYWYKSQTGEKEELLITAALVSQNCRLNLNAKTLLGINELLTALNPHPLLHRVLEISYDRDFQHVVIIQGYVSEGSLKDVIYNMARADAEWSEKYRRRSKGLPNKTVALYGRQILEAMMYLYRQGFPTHQLGHVQTGNVFVGADNVCRLGGYENTLLGYKTRLFRLCRQHEDRIDIIMFGHLVFEMCCGYELTTCVPRKQEYKTVKDKGLRLTLQYIFESGFPHSIEQISKKECFKEQQVQILEDQSLTQTCKSLLNRLKTSPPQQQDVPAARRKQPHSIVGVRPS